MIGFGFLFLAACTAFFGLCDLIASGSKTCGATAFPLSVLFALIGWKLG